MPSEKISNEMIYELLKAQSVRQDDFARRLDRFEKRFDQIDKRLDRLEDKSDHLDQRVRSVEDKIDGIRVSWSSKLVSGILATSAVTSAIVVLVLTSVL